MRLIIPFFYYGLTVCLMLGPAAARIEKRHAIVHANREHTLSKRYDGSRFSYYPITEGETACGGYYQDSDFVSTVVRYTVYDLLTEVMIGCRADQHRMLSLVMSTHYRLTFVSQQWDNGAHCGKQITLAWQGKSASATIVDRVSLIGLTCFKMLTFDL